jgi:hypothetical protein
MPCGLLPNYFFNDSFNFSDERMIEKGITWDNEIGHTFRPPNEKYANATRPLRDWGITNETTDEHFVVWMRIAKSSTVRKLWAKADNVSNLTTLTVNISCNFPVDAFPGERWIVLARLGALGGKNTFLSLANLTMSLVCGLGWAFCRRWRICCRRRHKFPGPEPLLGRTAPLYCSVADGESASGLDTPGGISMSDMSG